MSYGGIHYPDYSILAAGVHTTKAKGFTLAPPAPPDLVLGRIKELADRQGVRPITVAGYWYGKKAAGEREAPGEKVILYFHGGAYYMGTAEPSDMHVNIVDGILERPSSSNESTASIERVFSIDYRLCIAVPYVPLAGSPAALLDALAGWIYLVKELGFRTSLSPDIPREATSHVQ